MSRGHPDDDMWASTGHDAPQPPLASGSLALVGVASSLTLIVSPTIVWVRAVARMPPNVQHLPPLPGLSNVRTATGLSSGQGVLTLVAGIICLLIWILAWGNGSARYGIRLAGGSGVLAALALVLLVSVALDEAGFVKAQPVVGASASYELAAGFYVALLAGLTILALSAVTVARSLPSANSRT